MFPVTEGIILLSGAGAELDISWAFAAPDIAASSRDVNKRGIILFIDYSIRFLWINNA
ncbi:MAG: hypothetical protein KL787_03595 [Taibaiella sp.]|nr:hypothetical protein [Taibaiella sp.]